MNKITTGTVVRTICLALALINQILTVSGIKPLPIEDEQINLFISTIATIITAVIAWWKNNSITSEAIEADKVMKKLKEDK